MVPDILQAGILLELFEPILDLRSALLVNCSLLSQIQLDPIYIWDIYVGYIYGRYIYIYILCCSPFQLHSVFIPIVLD